MIEEQQRLEEANHQSNREVAERIIDTARQESDYKPKPTVCRFTKITSNCQVNQNEKEAKERAKRRGPSRGGGEINRPPEREIGTTFIFVGRVLWKESHFLL
ncbi:unnamed protein product [Arabis nemorensis]|uniref:Uncharacterized protein n=1 Tax=Arabis nemorensis TaxID=586526 RepID=A0A565B1G3_9BRAS|nr:unnamed protein product [Arabis nemorensis]